MDTHDTFLIEQINTETSGGALRLTLAAAGHTHAPPRSTLMTWWVWFGLVLVLVASRFSLHETLQVSVCGAGAGAGQEGAGGGARRVSRWVGVSPGVWTVRLPVHQGASLSLPPHARVAAPHHQLLAAPRRLDEAVVCAAAPRDGGVVGRGGGGAGVVKRTPAPQPQQPGRTKDAATLPHGPTHTYNIFSRSLSQEADYQLN